MLTVVYVCSAVDLKIFNTRRRWRFCLSTRWRIALHWRHPAGHDSITSCVTTKYIHHTGGKTSHPLITAQTSWAVRRWPWLDHLTLPRAWVGAGGDGMDQSRCWVGPRAAGALCAWTAPRLSAEGLSSPAVAVAVAGVRWHTSLWHTLMLAAGSPICGIADSVRRHPVWYEQAYMHLAPASVF